MKIEVSIIIPCRNEERYIRQCLDSILANEYPKEQMEILVVDGMSRDSTREIVSEYTARNPRIRLLDNPRHITPCAMNIGIRAARGTLIMKMDAHTIYGSNYIPNSVRFSREFNADNIGGVLTPAFRKDTLVTRCLKGVLSSRFGVGDSGFRTGTDQPRQADTVAFGCYRREVFDRVGLYNEALTRGQDMEFNLRLAKKGGRIILHPAITADYYPPQTIGHFIRHSFRNGKWAVVPFGLTDVVPVSVRHLVPLFFAGSLLAALLTGLVSGCLIPLYLIALAYASCAFYFAFVLSLRQGDARLSLWLPPVFFLFHISYGLGSLYGMIKSLGSRRFRHNFFFAKFR